MGETELRWTCRQCGSCVLGKETKCARCGYLRTETDLTSMKNPESTDSFVVNRLSLPSFGEIIKKKEPMSEGRTVVSVLVGVGVALFVLAAAYGAWWWLAH
jgi:hypothetical protein